MIEISFLAGELVFTVIWLLTRLTVWIVQRRIDRRREAQLLILYLYLAVIIRFTFFPLERVGGRVQPLIFDPDAILPFNVNLIPFQNLFAYETTAKMLVNLIGNLIMLLPCGILLPCLFKRLDCFWKVFAAGAGISLLIEAAQLLFPARMTDTNDLILNSIGVAVGYGVYRLTGAAGKRRQAE